MVAYCCASYALVARYAAFPFFGLQAMLITPKTCPASIRLSHKITMRAHLMRLSLHFLAGVVLGIFLLPEGASIALAAAAAAAGAKAFYDYLNRGFDAAACISLMAGTLVVMAAAA